MLNILAVSFNVEYVNNDMPIRIHSHSEGEKLLFSLDSSASTFRTIT